jgi:hypothetical protein
MKRRKGKGHNGWPMIAFCALVAVSGLTALNIAGKLYAAPVVPTVQAQGLDLETVAPCPAEDGPGTDGTVPCAFTSPVNSGRGYRWVLYADWCPVATVQTDVRCIPQAEWAPGDWARWSRAGRPD